MENAEVHVERGAEQLQRASYYQVGSSSSWWSSPPLNTSWWSSPPLNISCFLLLQQKSRRKVCVLVVVCSVALLILGIIIWKVSQ